MYQNHEKLFQSLREKAYFLFIIYAQKEFDESFNIIQYILTMKIKANIFNSYYSSRFFFMNRKLVKIVF